MEKKKVAHFMCDSLAMIIIPRILKSNECILLTNFNITILLNIQ